MLDTKVHGRPRGHRSGPQPAVKAPVLARLPGRETGGRSRPQKWAVTVAIPKKKISDSEIVSELRALVKQLEANAKAASESQKQTGRGRG
jgi:hypothetical protein